MGKRVLLILGHPDSDSFCGALEQAYADGARAAGAEVREMRLGEMKFDPILWKGYKVIQTLEPDLTKAQDNLTWAEHIVFVYPTWWATAPALLKGFIDRVFLPGFAFHYRAGALLPKKRLTGRSAHLIFTLDSPPWYYGLFIGSPGHKMMKKGVLEFSGIKPVRTTAIGSVKLSDDKKRKRWLEQVKRLGYALK